MLSLCFVFILEIEILKKIDMNLPILKYFDEFKHKSIKAYLFFSVQLICVMK